jgi:hypothetical protein
VRYLDPEFGHDCNGFGVNRCWFRTGRVNVEPQPFDAKAPQPFETEQHYQGTKTKFSFFA